MEMNGKEINIHELAKEMEAAGFTGQGMRTPEIAHNYIMMAAENPDIETELPEAGFRFWKACRFAFRVWQVRTKRGLPIQNAPLDRDEM